jgi:hypothetical protein
MELTIPREHSRPTALETNVFQCVNLIGEENMKSPAITGNRLPAQQATAPKPATQSVEQTQVSTPTPNDKPLQGSQFQQGRARAASLRQALEQNTPAVERKPLPAARTVIKYPADQKSTRRQRTESHEDLMPLDEEIHQLNGSRRNVQQDRKQVLAQRRQANRGFKNISQQRTEPVDDLAIEGWGDDH